MTTSPQSLPTTATLEEKRLLKVSEVAKLPIMANISERHLWTLIAEGSFPHRRISDRKVLILYPDDINNWLEATGLAAA